ncbi:hypothetical protein F2P81_019239 [Scophthalmus maximus]|uniref:Rotatin N-terminal domain-containing protein n=1 Tax=Scophthalmus maximus TaxID=52904 RepID=A0A6A4SBX8_SCOMX|nr:hypothetical protein F2P81_019239 [Scophthalmus maximus]
MEPLAGHSLVEIRVRALKSIVCKLDHSLISVSDIVQEKMLFVYLLEWFNFPEVPMQEEALELLTTLSKHPSAAQMLRDVGAVDFLTQLAPNVEPRLRAVISGTLDQLFQLPDLLPSKTTVYSHGPHSTAPTAPTVVPPEDFSKMGYFHKRMLASKDIPPHKIPGEVSYVPLRSSFCFTVHETVRCLKFSVFPWLTLTNTDRHILSSNESSLRSNNPNMVRTTCDLLCDVIMQDFPPEIFLQRPSIVKSLLSLLRVGSGRGEPRFLHSQALSCLRQLCAGLRRRLRFHQDPSFYSTKHDPVSQNSSFSCSQEVRGTQRSQASSPGVECSPRPSVVGRTGQRARGDGQDGDAASNSGSSHRGGAALQAPVQTPQSPADSAHVELPDLGVEDVLELQLQQLTLAQFTVAIMEHAIPLLKTEGSHVFHRVLELLCDAIPLLGDSVCELVWDDRSLVGMELKEKLQAFMELLGDILSYHQSHRADTPHSSQIHHRMAYMGTAIFTIKLLQTILPTEKAGDNLPESTATAIFHLCLDTSLGSLLPSVQENAVAYLEQVNSDHHDLYRGVTRAALWMESTCNFLKEAEAEGEKNWLELLELADLAIDGLPFHQHLPIVKECVHICSYLWKFDQPSPLLQTESQKLLLKLLSHPLLPVKTETYTCALNLVKDSVGIQNVSRQEQGSCDGVNFLLHYRVLYEISAFGLQDSAEKGYVGTEESLGNCVLLISDTSDVARDDVFPSTAKLKAALRLLFTKQPAVRIAAVQQVTPHLTNADEVKTVRPDLDQAVMSTLPNLYCLRNPLDISLDTNSKSVLKVESVEKLFCILSSDTVDISLRRSAAEQLSVVLQDTTMHPVLKSLGITDTVISFIMESVKGNKSSDCLLEPCVCILRKLVYADPSLRHSLAQRNLLLLTLLRASLILKENKSSGNEIAVLMSLLLFDEIASIEIWSDKRSADVTLTPFSLPLTVIRRYNIPFQAASHHAVSPYRCVLPPSSGLLTLAPARQALQVAWNTAWHSGIDNLLEELRGISTGDPEFHPDLKLSEAQILSLQATHLPAALQDCIQAIVTAAAHSSVTSALSRLSLYLLIDRLSLPHIPTHSCRGTLHSLSWQAAVSRFLQVRPACVEDERLLVGVIGFLNAYFRQINTESASDPDDKDLRWILELLLNQETVSLLSLLLDVEKQTSTENTGELEQLKNHVSQRLQRELTSFFNTLLLRLTHTTDRLCLALAGPFKSQLAVCLLRSLRVSDAPCFYGLPSLERTLQGMVKFASLALGAALSSVPSGCRALCASCQNISGGLWGTLLNILLDQQESSMVRREAAFILQNLLVMPMPANAEEAKDSDWQHPCVHDEVSGVSLVGLPALQALLYHCQYFQHVALSASACYRGRYTFHLQPASSGATQENSENSLWSWRCDPPAPSVNSRRPSSSLSTSSTLVSSCSGTFEYLKPTSQSDTDNSESVNSQDSRQGESSAVEPVVMVTPDLLTAHCGLLTNLLSILSDFTLSAIRHNWLLPALASLVDVRPIEKCVNELNSPNVLPGEREDIKGQFVTLLQFLSSFSKLLQSCVTVSQELIPELDVLKQLLTTLVAVLMLDTRGLDAGTRNTVCLCWADVFMLLATLVRRDSSAAYPSVSAALGKRWRTFAGTLSLCVTEKFADPLLHTVALHFLSAIFTEETKSRGDEAVTSNSMCAAALSDIVNGPPASQLCELLLQSFEKRSHQDPLKKLTARALLTLLACSPTAQNHAAKAGLIDSCVEQMKQTHSHLHLESVRPSKASHRKKEEGRLKGIKLTVEILRSALYRSDECKVSLRVCFLIPHC